jgi:hypothetical protein
LLHFAHLLDRCFQSKFDLLGALITMPLPEIRRIAVRAAMPAKKETKENEVNWIKADEVEYRGAEPLTHHRICG